MRNGILVLAVITAGCAVNQGPQSLNTSDTRICAKNFTTEGSFLAGKVFRTKQDIPGVKKSTAMKKAAQYTAANGWSIIDTNNDIGVISAAQTVSFGSGKSAPLTIAVNENQGGVNLTLSYSISGGVSAPEHAVKDEFCQIIASVSEK